MACEQFLGKNVQDIKNVVLQTLEGHLRSILGKALPRPGTPLLPSRASQDLQAGAGEGRRAGQGGLSVLPRLSFKTSGDLRKGEGPGMGR